MRIFISSFKIFLALFKFQLLKMMLLVFISFFIITIIPIVINSYNQSLEKSLATKQPHLIIKYLDDKQSFTEKQLIQMQNKIKIYIGQNQIININSFVQKNSFIKLKSYGHNLSEYNGYIDAIGLSKDNYPICYDFDTILPVMLNDYGFKLTGIEIFDKFLNEESLIFFNNSLYQSIQPLVTYEAKFNMKYLFADRISSHTGNFFGVIEDFYDKPIIYMDYKFLNKILGYNENHISGFMINIADQKKLHIVQKQLELFFNKDKKTTIITNWREINKKQNDIFKIFTEVGSFLKWIILVLSTSAVTIYLYKILLIKQPQLRLLNILGLRLVYILNITVSILIGITIVLASYTAHKSMVYLYKNIIQLNLKVEIEFYLYDILISYTILLFFVITIIRNLFNQNYSIFK